VLRQASEPVQLMQPTDQWVPTAKNLAHQTFIPCFNRPQVAESGGGYGGWNKAVSIERDSFGKDQLLEPLSLFERGLYPQIRCAWENAFCELTLS
jgi:hypothetical protein